MKRGKVVRSLVAMLAAVSLGVAGACSAGAGDTGGGAKSEQVDKSVRALLPAALRDSGVLRVGTPLQNPPVIFKKGSAVDGFGAELVTAVAEVMGLRVQFVETSLPGLFPGLSADKFDLIGGIILNDTPEREKSADIISLSISESGLLVSKGNPAGINTIDDLCDHAVGVLQGSVQEQLLTQQSQKCASAGKAKIDLKRYPDAPTVLAQLQAGRLDAFAATSTYATYMAKTVQNGNALEVSKLVYQAGVTGMAVLKGNTKLAKAVQAAIRKTIETGTYGSIHDKWEVGSQKLPADDILINGATKGAFSKYETA